jgi:DNA-binding transcriptional LysR family regulator
MDINQIKYFLSVAQHLNFTKAAQENFITQPAMSRQISELEKEIGFKLFVRIYG